MGDFTVHRLTAGEIGTMRAMNRLFGAAFEEPDSYGAAPPDDEWIEGLLAGDQFVALAATAGLEVVGALAAYVLPKFEQARREIYIYDLAVAETHRRRGIATALIRALQHEARALGARAVYVQAGPHDAPAVALYTRLGTREEVLHFDIALPEPWTGRDALHNCR